MLDDRVAVVMDGYRYLSGLFSARIFAYGWASPELARGCVAGLERLVDLADVKVGYMTLEEQVVAGKSVTSR